jgi:hypothetical protein
MIRNSLSILLIFASAAALHAQTLTLDGVSHVQKAPQSTLELVVEGTANELVWVGIDTSPGPAVIFGQTVPFGFSADWALTVQDNLDGAGRFEEISVMPSSTALNGLKLYVLAAIGDPSQPGNIAFTNGASLEFVVPTAVTEQELAGRALAAGPSFTTDTTFNFGTEIAVGVSPDREAYLAGKTADIYMLPARDAAEWANDAGLIDVSCDGADTVHFGDTGVADNLFVIDDGCAAPSDALPIGAGYDIVIDVDRDGLLGPGDVIDGAGDKTGCFIVPDIGAPGPYPTVEINYGGGMMSQNTFYPANIGELGPRPLVVVSHGNGHQFVWYDHIGHHLASWGYVVMSHFNNTQPGVNSAATTTLTNTDSFLGSLSTIGGGVLNGLVDSSRMTWIGHSRGGEGVTIAYNRVVTGTFTPQNFVASDVRLVSSIAPTVFTSATNAEPGDVNYHLWVGSADSDVDGCPGNQVTTLYALLSRADRQKQSITLQGVGHDNFHNAPQPLSFGAGPNQLDRPETHAIMRGYLLALIEYHVEDNQAMQEYLWRPWDEFRPASTPNTPDAVVNLTFEEDATGPKVLVVDDYQTQTSTATASSGAAVSFNVQSVSEGRFADGNNSLGFSAGDAFNGFTQAFSSTLADNPRGVVFEWNGADRFYDIDLGLAGLDASAFEHLSFRAAQGPRHPRTTALNAAVDFEVRVEDTNGQVRNIRLSDLGISISEPYARGGCGAGVGWAAEFETVRIPLGDLSRGADGIDVTSIAKIGFRFGPSHGSPQGRLGLDHIVFERR